MRHRPPAQPEGSALRRYARFQRWDRRHLATVRRLLDLRPGDRILEVGCGRGYLASELEKLGCRAVGIDANPEAVASAVASDVRLMRVEAMDFPDAKFDAVVAVHVIEHFPQVEAALVEMTRVLAYGGRMLLIYPAEPIRGLFAMPDATVIYGNPFRARELHRHRLTPKKVRRLTAPLGLDHLHSEFNALSSPQFVTLLAKPA